MGITASTVGIGRHHDVRELKYSALRSSQVCYVRHKAISVLRSSQGCYGRNTLWTELLLGFCSSGLSLFLCIIISFFLTPPFCYITPFASFLWLFNPIFPQFIFFAQLIFYLIQIPETKEIPT